MNYKYYTTNITLQTLETNFLKIFNFMFLKKKKKKKKKNRNKKITLCLF